MSDFLFARPSILEGIGRNADLFGTLQVYNASNTPEEADEMAFRNDLATLARDARVAFTVVRGKHESPRKK